MLPGGLDGAYRALLAGPYHPFTRLEVWRQGVRVDPFGEEGVPLYSGSLSATLASQVTRQLSFATDEALWPLLTTDLLAPYGNEVYAFQGVYNGAGVPYEWQTFRGRINEVTLAEDGSLNVFCLDRAADVNDSGFVLPENSNTGNAVTEEFKRLVRDGVADATFGAFDTITTNTPALVWESDRASACDDLAEAAGAYWYALANGDYVIRIVPWTVERPSVLTIADGEGGTIASAEPTLSRENVFNVVTVVGERADGTAPVYATISDQVVSSPTYVNGPFGVKSKLIQAQAAQNFGQALSIAKTSLRQAKALTQAWTVLTTADPALELGDVLTIQARNLPSVTQVVAAFTLPLTGAEPMQISFRELQPGLVEE